VVIVHGGSGIRGDKGDWWPATLADRLAGEGFLTLSINYRLAPKHRWPAAVDDVAAAIDSFRARSSALSGDGSRIFVIGMSAGALFAEMAAARQPHSIAGIISISGVHDLTSVRQPWVDALLGDADRRAASPLHAACAEFPPTLLIHGEQDVLIPIAQSLAMRHALTSRGHQARLIRMPAANHFAPPAKYFMQCYPYIVRWLREQSAHRPADRPLSVAWLCPVSTCAGR
jgi:acetyl esterase/lipase